MLKVSHKKDVSLGNAGVNWDGTIILVHEEQEYFVHPDDLKPGMIWAAAVRMGINITQDHVDELNAVLEAWKQDGNTVMDKGKIRSL